MALPKSFGLGRGWALAAGNPGIYVPVPPPEKLAPSAGWTGIEGSGFGGGYETEPTPSTGTRARTDPAMPVTALEHGDREAFLSDYVISASAFSSGGVSAVRFHMEGKHVDVTAITPRTIIGGDGVEHTIWGYHATVDHAAFTANGWARYYVEAIPTDPLKASRIIGPFGIKRKTGASIYDATFTFGPGGTYATFNAAIDAVRSATGDHYNLIPTESHTWTPTTLNFTRNVQGIVDVTPAPGVVFSISKATEGYATVRLRVGCVRWNKGVVFDVKYIGGFTSEVGHYPMWFNGCELFSSAGQDELGGSTGLDNAKTMRTAYLMSAQWLTEVYWHDTLRGPIYNQLTRNCRIKNITEDSLSISSGLKWVLTYGSTVEHNTATGLRNNIDAITATYSGAATTATVSTTGTVDTSGRSLQLKEDGATVKTIAMSTTAGSGIYTMDDIVASIATQAGWTATVVNNDRRAASIGGVSNVTNVNAKGIAAVIGAGFDVHGDVFQLPAASHSENFQIINNICWDLTQNQFFFLSAQTSPGELCDGCFINNAGSLGVAISGSKSQYSGPHSHVISWFNTLAGEDLVLRADATYLGWKPDANCSFYGNVYQRMGYTGGVAVSDIVEIAYNHIMDGAPPAGALVANNSTGGTNTSLLVDHPVGDFTPKGSLLTDLIPRRILFDAKGIQRGANTTKGAVIAASGG